jgi:hypothetical protein
LQAVDAPGVVQEVEIVGREHLGAVVEEVRRRGHGAVEVEGAHGGGLLAAAGAERIERCECARM